MDPIVTNIIVAVGSAIIAGGISAVFGSLLTTAALRVQMSYIERECLRLDTALNKEVNRLDAAIVRAHDRIDDVET